MTLPTEIAQWLGFTEESFLIQDGLLRLGDMVEAPPDAISLCDKETRTQHILSLDNSNAGELCSRIEQLCRRETGGFKNLLKYRISALKGLWNARKKFDTWEKEREEVGIPSVRQRKNGSHDSSSNFSSKLSLLLLFPLIKSQASVDPSLCQVTTKLLLESLRECPPLSLKEPGDCLDGIEDLVCSWLGEGADGRVRETARSQASLETAAAALVTLACARNSTKTLVHTIYMLHQLKSLEHLPVHDIISIFGALEGGANVPPTLSSSKHINCWPYNDQINNIDEEPINDLAKRSISTDGSYFYITNSNGCGLSKMGTGLSGTMRGFIYTKNTSFEAGFVAYASNVLLYRPYSLENNENSGNIGVIVDMNTLQPKNTINSNPALMIDCKGQVSTLSLTSNGMEFYWIRNINTNSDDCPVTSHVSNLIILDVFCIDSTTNIIKMCSTRKILSKKEECHEKSASIENLLRPKRSNSTSGSLESASQSTHSSVGLNQNTNKDDSSTSVGIPIKTLRLCPIITCGNFITIISPATPATSPASHLARTLFSGGTNSSKSYAVCNSFSIKDGFFNSKADLIDANNSAFSKGALLTSMCATFDTFNNSIWVASMDHIDQFQNTGHQAASFNYEKLGIVRNLRIMTNREDNMASLQEVTSTLIEHTGLVSLHLMATHQSNSAYNPNCEKIADMKHVEMIIALLEEAVSRSDEKGTLCLLVLVQFVIKSSRFDKITENWKELFSRLRSSLWKIIKKNDNEKTTSEACKTVLEALHLLYPTYVNRTDLLTSLLIEESKDIGSLKLRQLILTHFSLILNNSNDEAQKQFLWRAFDLNQIIIKHTVRETKMLINGLTEVGEENIEILSTTPKSTGSLQYVSSLMKSLLAKCLLENMDDEEELQIVIDIIEELFDCCLDLFEYLKEKVIFFDKFDSDGEKKIRISAIENIIKNSVLSRGLLPTATLMTEPPFQSLDICQNFISKLIQLSNITCEISKLIISIGKQKEKNEDNNHSSIFSTLKVPEPWKAGKIIESSHPLRDNYKFKETIKIPGATCLYLKFDKRCSTQYDYDKLVLHTGLFRRPTLFSFLQT